MNLKFGQVAQYAPTVAKVLRSEILTDMDDAILIGELKKPFMEAEELLGKAKNVISFKYAKLAEARITDDDPKGFNSVKELEEQVKDNEKLRDKICTSVDFTVNPLSADTIKILWEGIPEIVDIEGKKKASGKKLNSITAEDIANLTALGLKKSKKK